jgi:hypothetical protein
VTGDGIPAGDGSSGGVCALALLFHSRATSMAGCTTNSDSYPEDGRENLMEALGRCGFFTQGIGKYHFNYADYHRDSRLNGLRDVFKRTTLGQRSTNTSPATPFQSLRQRANIHIHEHTTTILTFQRRFTFILLGAAVGLRQGAQPLCSLQSNGKPG